MAPEFADEYRIVLFDHVGAGGSDLRAYDRAKYSSLDGYAADMLEICRELELREVTSTCSSPSPERACAWKKRWPNPGAGNG